MTDLCTNERLVAQLQRQLAAVLDPWVNAHGRDSCNGLALKCLGRYFQPVTRLSRLEQENGMLQAQVAALRLGLDTPEFRQLHQNTTGLVTRVKRETFALGAPLSVDDQQALQTLVSNGSASTADALGKHLIALAEQAGSGPIEVEERASLDPKRDHDAEGAQRTQHAQDRLWAASKHGRQS